MIFLRRREIVRHPAGNHHKGCLLGIQENPDIDIGKKVILKGSKFTKKNGSIQREFIEILIYY